LFPSSDEVVNLWLRAQFFLQPESVGLVNEFADEAFRVVGIAEIGCPSDAGGHALGKQSPLNSVQAEVAFSGITDGRLVPFSLPSSVILKGRRFLNGCNFRSPFSVVIAKIKRAGTVRASGNAISAADAGFIVNNDNSVRSLPCRLDRANWGAWRVVTLHARSWEKTTGNSGIFADFLLQNRTVNDAGWQFVLNDTSDSAGFTTNTLAQVNDHNPSALL